MALCCCLYSCFNLPSAPAVRETLFFFNLNLKTKSVYRPACLLNTSLLPESSDDLKSFEVMALKSTYLIWNDLALFVHEVTLVFSVE